jgi:hypothetical protein
LLLLAALAMAVGLAIALYGVYGAPYAALAGPSFAELADPLVESGQARVIVGAAAGLAILLLGGFYLPGALDLVALSRLAGRIERLGLEATPEALLAAFRNGPLLREGRSIVAGLWQGRTGTGAINPAWRSAVDPAELLRPERATRTAEASFYGSASLVLLALGIAASFWLDRTRLGGDLAVALVGTGLGSVLLVRLLSHLRQQQLADIAVGIRAHFPAAATEFLLDRMSGLASEDAAARAAAIDRAGHDIAAELTKAIDEMKTTLASHDRRIAASVAQSVQRVVQPIASSIEQTLSRLETANLTGTQQLLNAVLNEFLAAFHQRFATQMQEIADLLAGTRILAEELREAFIDSEAARGTHAEKLNEALLETMKQAVENAARRQAQVLGELVEEVGKAIVGTADGLRTLEARTADTAERWTAQSEAVANAVIARNAEEMRRTAGAFSQLHSIIETLSISVLPAINRLVTTQERLHVAIESSRGSAQSTAEAARDLGEAARIAREMVERQMLFTRELAQLAAGGAEGSRATPDSDAAAVRPASGADADLARALVDLRAEADSEMRELPRL